MHDRLFNYCIGRLLIELPFLFIFSWRWHVVNTFLAFVFARSLYLSSSPQSNIIKIKINRDKITNEFLYSNVEPKWEAADDGHAWAECFEASEDLAEFKHVLGPYAFARWVWVMLWRLHVLWCFVLLQARHWRLRV